MPKLPKDLPTTLRPTAKPTAELDRLGDQIAELSAHVEAATGRLLGLIREFDARGGWNTGFRSCAEWLAWRVPSGRCLLLPMHLRAGSSPTPRPAP